ncbi:GNAT family N-acetyltransferase [Microbispora sp. NPDC049125]|uniref:GNAT family N-acetyltransferase n=1 Tax=Microbispora sp. NPDC049125 TaxID=3154929 RepID=UPI003465DFA5
MRELTGAGEVADACGDDDLVVWAAQGMRPGVRAWAYGDAVAVASPQASRRDRLAVRGPLHRVVPLVRHALAEAGPSYRPFGDAPLIRELADGIAGLRLSGGFSWMVTTTLTRPVPPDPVWPDPVWLDPDDDPEVTDLLKEANPGSYAMPGIPRVRRWAGIRHPRGPLLTVAADAWPAPTVGLLAGVATAPQSRGQGLGERICRFVAAALLAEHGRVALMVDDWNGPAIGVYERLGFARRLVAAAEVADPGPAQRP